MNYQSYFKFSELFKFGDDADGEEFGLENEQQKPSQPTREDTVKDKDRLEAINIPDPGKYSIQTKELTCISMSLFQWRCTRPMAMKTYAK